MNTLTIFSSLMSTELIIRPMPKQRGVVEGGHGLPPTSEICRKWTQNSSMFLDKIRGYGKFED
jgi:hypothetical protein